MINVGFRSGFRVLAMLWFAVPLCLAPAQAQTDTQRLAAQLAPLWQALTTDTEPFALSFDAEIELDDESQQVRGQLVRYDSAAFDLDIIHPDYSLRLRRRDRETALALPHHRTFFYGTGDVDQANLHNVLFVPQDGVLYVANATHHEPAANQPYARIDLTQLLAEIADNPSTPVSTQSRP